MPKTHFVFDLDDNLADSGSFNQQIFVEEFTKYLDTTNPEIDSYLRDLHTKRKGTAMRDQFSEAISYFDLKLDPETLAISNEKLQAKKIHQIDFFPEVKNFLEALQKSNKKLFIFSNRRTVSLLKLLNNHNLTPYFNEIISCADAGFEKPNPYCLNKLIEKHGLPKENYVYFGDSQTDVEMACRANVDYLVINHYQNSKKVYQVLLNSFLTN